MRRGAWLCALLLLCACGGAQPTPTANRIPAATGVAGRPPAAMSTVQPRAASPGTPPPATVAASPPTTPSTPAAAAASGTPAPDEVVQGTGNAMSAPLTLPMGVGFVRFTHQGQGHFTADLMRADGTPARLTVVEGTGARAVLGTFSAPLAGTYTFAVRADGPWTIAVWHPTEAELAQAHPLPQTFTGQGSGITSFFTATGRGITVAVGYRGAGDIHVRLAGGGDETRVYDGPGPGDSEGAVVPIPGGCTCVFLVDAEGPWTIEVRP